MVRFKFYGLIGTYFLVWIATVYFTIVMLFTIPFSGGEYSGKGLLKAGKSLNCQVIMKVNATSGSALDYPTVRFKFDSRSCLIDLELCNIGNNSSYQHNITISKSRILFKEYSNFAGFKEFQDSLLVFLIAEPSPAIDTFCIKLKIKENAIH